jgi:hypothetical protein
MSKHWTIKEHRELIKSVHRRTSGLKRKRGSPRQTTPISVWKLIAADVNDACGSNRSHYGCSKQWHALSEDVQTTMLINDVAPEQPAAHLHTPEDLPKDRPDFVTRSKLIWMDEIVFGKGVKYTFTLEGEIDGRKLVRLEYDVDLTEMNKIQAERRVLMKKLNEGWKL